MDYYLVLCSWKFVSNTCVNLMKWTSNGIGNRFLCMFNICIIHVYEHDNTYNMLA